MSNKVNLDAYEPFFWELAQHIYDNGLPEPIDLPCGSYGRAVNFRQQFYTFRKKARESGLRGNEEHAKIAKALANIVLKLPRGSDTLRIISTMDTELNEIGNELLAKLRAQTTTPSTPAPAAAPAPAPVPDPFAPLQQQGEDMDATIRQFFGKTPAAVPDTDTENS